MAKKLGAKQRTSRTILKELRQLLTALKDLSTTTRARPRAALAASGNGARTQSLADVHRAHRALRRMGEALERLRVRVPGFWRGVSTLDASHADGVRIFDRYLGARGPELRRLAGRLEANDLPLHFGVDSWAELAADVERRHHAFALRRLRPLTLNRPEPERTGTTQQALGDSRTDPSSGDLGAAAWVVLGATLIGALLYGLGQLFNDHDDDMARDEISTLDCNGINAKSDAHWIAQFKAMINGPTGNEDENAMLKVLACLPDSRVIHIVTHFGLEDFMDEFQGEEADILALRLQKAGLLSFADWDDDASRRFIKQSSTANLAVLSIGDIVALCRNMFRGSCGDEDEDAILRLLKAQDICKVKQVLKKITFDEFDDNVDGEQWDKLSALLNTAKKASC